ncbi:hypothetical protein SERLA73DRAFT_53035, partial [Serpula lacrymans var. lacrymans S7.3]
KHRLPLNKLEMPITCKNVDGTISNGGKINHYTYQQIEAGGRNAMCKFLITGLGKEDILLGYPWLHKVNPTIDWTSKSVDTQ